MRLADLAEDGLNNLAPEKVELLKHSRGRRQSPADHQIGSFDLVEDARHQSHCRRFPASLPANGKAEPARTSGRVRRRRLPKGFIRRL